MYCYCCTTEYAGLVTALCPRCHRIRHLLSVYGDRVLEVLESVLVRSPSGQSHKINSELKVEKEKIVIENNTAASLNDDEKVLTRSKSKYSVEK